MTDDDLYDAFVEGFFERGTTQVPADWPRELQDRCRFFLRLVDDTGFSSEFSVCEASGLAGGVQLEAAGGDPPASLAAHGERYVIERELARGGMGRILLAYDRDFRRRVAVKVLLGSPADRRRTARFFEEAQATAQLEHPNIAPVYDLGLDKAGSPYFLMKWIRGRSLHDLLAAGTDEFSPTRLLQVVQQAAMGVHFANSRGVIHRDLKPQNIMVGDYGEVLIVDWGLAKILNRPGEDSQHGEAVSTERASTGEATLDGTVQGSLAYMAPEQARGEIDSLDARTDVFGLGAILYQVLTGAPPLPAHPGADFALRLAQARKGEVLPPRERAPERAIPEELDRICRQALAARPQDRFPTAREFHDAIQRHIEGIHDAERRQAEARRLLAAAGASRVELERLAKEEDDLRHGEEVLRQRVADHESEEAKRPLWEASARREAAGEAVAGAFNRTAAAYMAVLSVEPREPAAREGLATLYFGRLAQAEGRGDREAALLYEGLVRQHDDGKLAVELAGECDVRLETAPPGCEVTLHRYEAQGPLLVAGEPRRLGITPLALRLPRGSYLAVLRKPGCEETRYPFLLERSAAHHARVRMPPAGSIAEGFLFVPGGETIIGGDARGFVALPRARVWIGDLFAARFPVTLGEYCTFLDDEARSGQQSAKEVLPFSGSEEFVVREPGGRHVPTRGLDPRIPVMGVPIQAAFRYSDWLGRQRGKRVRLLSEAEWERCARGADGRTYPWGNGFDWALCKGRPSRQREPGPEPVGSFPRDLSPFGVRDLGGGIREFCAGCYGEGYRVLRGGSWFNPVPLVFRADCRTSLQDGSRAADAGFRVCYDEGG